MTTTQSVKSRHRFEVLAVRFVHFDEVGADSSAMPTTQDPGELTAVDPPQPSDSPLRGQNAFIVAELQQQQIEPITGRSSEQKEPTETPEQALPSPSPEPVTETNSRIGLDQRLARWEDRGLTSATGFVHRSTQLLESPSMRWTRMVPHGLLMVAVVWYALRFSQLVIRRHNEFGSFDYDLGIYDQGIWLLGEGRQFLTVRGIRFFGHHWNPATVLFVPFYKWFGAGPNLLNVAQAIAVSAGAIPTYVATRKISRSSWIGLAVAIAYLGHPSSGWLIQELFHSETMAIPFVFGAWAFALHDRWRWYGACIVMALLWKEDIALATAMLGLFVVWRKNRSISLITFFGSVAYFLVSTKLIIPAFLGRNVFYEDLYGDLGSSMSDIGKTAITDPSKVQKVLRDHDAEKYANSIMRPYGYIGFLSPSYLMVGVPQFFANLLSTLGFIWDPRFHYVAMPLVGSTMAAARAIATRTKWWLRCALVVVMLLFVHGVRNDGIGPWSSKYDDGFWPTSNQRTTAIWKEAISHIPDDPTVVTSSMYLATPHLTHRPEAYTFPNPWKISYWGVGGEQPRDARRVDYVVLNEQSLGEQDRATYNDAIVNSGDFQLVFRPAPSDPQIVTWRRINNGLHSLPPMPKAPSVGAPAPN